MNDQNSDGIPILASVTSLAVALVAATGLSILWWNSRTLPYALGAIGFLLVSPIWFLAPLDIRSVRRPLGSRATYRRKLTPLQGGLSLFGYAIILAAVVTWLVQARST